VTARSPTARSGRTASATEAAALRRRTARVAATRAALLDACGAVPGEALPSGWPPLAAAFHFGTRDVDWLRGSREEARELEQERRSNEEPPPGPFKPVRGTGIALPAGPYVGQFADVLLDRRTWRGFGRGPIRKEQLGPLLDLTFGARMIATTRSGGNVLFKTSPSGGACHPIEGYVLALRVAHVRPGLYHYSPRTARLHLIRQGATSRQAVACLAGQTWFAGAAAIVFMTAQLPRVWRRYDHARAYRAVLIEAGHVCQTFCLAATWLGLAPFSTMALEDRRIERDLGIDGVREVLLYAAGVGARPDDGRWVQWPGNRPDVADAGLPRTAAKPRARQPAVR
jgi:SagB-type dehydrogenase family enzyme